MQFYQVRNFDRFQHFRNRRVVWIKLYVDLLSNPEFLALPDATRGHLMQLWIVAAQRNNRLPADERLLRKAIRAKSKLRLDLMMERGFLQKLDIHDSAREEKTSPNPPIEKTEERTCTYCGTPESAVDWRFIRDHVYPRSLADDAPGETVWACSVCNQIKRDRVFQTIREARRHIHWTLWASSRARYADARAICFGGEPPFGWPDHPPATIRSTPRLKLEQAARRRLGGRALVTLRKLLAGKGR